MKTLFISFNRIFFLHTEGNIVVSKYDLLNDICYELGAELVFKTKTDFSANKSNLITDYREDRPDDFKTFYGCLIETILSVILNETVDIDGTIDINLPDSYLEWLKFHTNPDYKLIGESLSKTKSSIIQLQVEDLWGYIKEYLDKNVRTLIATDAEINKYTIVEAKTITALNGIINSFKENIVYEPYDGSWVQCEIASALYNGIGAEKDIDKSFYFYEKASEQGNNIAANWLGWCYQTGNCIPKDENKALIYYQKGSDLGNPNSDANLGYCYHLGIGTEINYQKAEEYYLKGAKAGISFAQVNLANIYYDGLLGASNFEEAFRWYSEAAKSNDQIIAKYKVGMMLLEGKGTNFDYERGMEFLRATAKDKYIPAVLYYSREIAKSKELPLIKEAFNILDTCEDRKSMNQRNPEVFYLQGKLAYEFPELEEDPSYWLGLVRDNEFCPKYEPAIILLEQIEKEERDKKEQQERILRDKIESLMGRACYTKEEINFLEDVGLYPEWKGKNIEEDKFHVKYNRKYHRLVSLKKSVFDYYFQLLDGNGYKEFAKKLIIEDWEKTHNGNKMDASEELFIDFTLDLGTPEYFTHYKIEEGTRVICDDAFRDCKDIKDLLIPKSVRVIGNNAFSDTDVTTLVIPKSVEEIGVDALPKALKILVIENGDIKINTSTDDEYEDEDDVTYGADGMFRWHRCDDIEKIIVPADYKERFQKLFPSVIDKIEEQSNATSKNTADIMSTASQLESKIQNSGHNKPLKKEPSTPSKKSKNKSITNSDKGKIAPTTKSTVSKKETVNPTSSRSKVSSTKKAVRASAANKESKTGSTREPKAAQNTEKRQSIFSKLKSLFK